MSVSAWMNRACLGGDLGVTTNRFAGCGASVGPDRWARGGGTAAGVAATSRALEAVFGCAGRGLPALAGRSLILGASA
jgi:hypothetical protein